MTTDVTGGRKQRVVVGVDGSESSKAALRWAARMAPAIGAEIEAVITWQFPGIYAWTVGVAEGRRPDVDAGKLLDDALADVFGSDRPANLVTRVREGGASHELLAASSDAALLVVGSRGHGGFAGLLLGSVSTACAEHATCPVLVVHGQAVEASAALQELLAAAQSGGCSESDARRALHTILTGFLDQLPRQDRLHLVDSLPQDVQSLTRSPALSKMAAELFDTDLDGLVEACKRAVGCTRDTAHEIVVEVLQTLHQLLPEHSRDVQAELPSELADVWMASPVMSRPPQRSD
jgi:nucleotide-binding universal stress UspA family protein/uncharacterized protein (DUF2267 family)